MTRRPRLHWSSVGVLFATVLFWSAVLIALASCRTADAADGIRWDRTWAQQDSLVVSAGWAASCDVRGCADGYRVTWTIDDPTGPNATPPIATDRARVAAPPRVLRETVVSAPRDTVRVPLPVIGQPQTVCLYVTALRRGLASDVRSACRTVEAPDAPPPPVDSITWDSVPPVEPLVSRMTLDSLSDTLAVLISKWAWRHDSTGAIIDSVLVERTPRVRIRDPETGMILVPANDKAFRVGEAVALCAMIPHRYEADVAVISVPGVAFQRPSMVRRHQQMCAEALALDWPERTRIRWVSDAMPGLPHPMPTDTVHAPGTRLPTRSGV